MRLEFKTPFVTKLFDINRNRFQVWLDRGWVTPSIQKAKGQGRRNKFSKEDLYMIALFKLLVESGFSRELAGRMFKFFNEGQGYKMRMLLTMKTDDECWFEIHYLDDGEWRITANTGVKHSIGRKSKGKPLENVQYFISADMRKIRRAIDKKIAEMK